MLCKEYRENKRMLEELEALQDNIKLEIISLMGDNDTIIDGADKVTYKAIQSSRFDSNSFKKSYPDLRDRDFLILSNDKDSSSSNLW